MRRNQEFPYKFTALGITVCAVKHRWEAEIVLSNCPNGTIAMADGDGVLHMAFRWILVLLLILFEDRIEN